MISSRCFPAAPLLFHITQMSTYEQKEFYPFLIKQQTVGYIHQDYLPLLRQHRDIFMIKKRQISLHPALATADSRTAALDQLVQSWTAQGKVQSHWEMYDVLTHWGGMPLMKIMRHVHRMFGIMSFGVHITGYQFIEDVLHIWVGERARHKMTYPGRLDTFVAGGRSSGLSATEVMIKECREEANIPLHIAQKARPVGAISYQRQLGASLERDTMFVFDLEIPAHIKPKPDGDEVAAFHCWPIEQIYQKLADSRDFKDNCNLVLIDFMIRHGYISADDPDYLKLIKGLHQALE